MKNITSRTENFAYIGHQNRNAPWTVEGDASCLHPLMSQTGLHYPDSDQIDAPQQYVSRWGAPGGHAKPSGIAGNSLRNVGIAVGPEGRVLGRPIVGSDKLGARVGPDKAGKAVGVGVSVDFNALLILPTWLEA